MCRILRAYSVADFTVLRTPIPLFKQKMFFFLCLSLTPPPPPFFLFVLLKFRESDVKALQARRSCGCLLWTMRSFVSVINITISPRLQTDEQTDGETFFLQIKSSVRWMLQNQPSGRGLLPSPTAWSPDQRRVS